MNSLLCVIEDLGPGGAQRQMVNLALALKAKGISVSFLIYLKRDFYNEPLRNAGIKVIEVIESRPLQRVLKMRREIRHGRYDAVLSFLTPSNFISAISTLPLKKARLVVGERSANPVILRSFKSRFMRYFHLLADFVVANSHANLEMVRTVNPLLKKDRCKVIYNMVDLDVWCPPANFQFKKNGKLRLVVAASHRYLKNLMGLLKAMNRLDERERNKLEVEWYGDKTTVPFYDNSYTECMAFIDAHNLSELIRIHPAISDVKAKMEQADAIGLFSFFEGLPNAVCEGMALGKPILASRVSDVSRLVNDNVNGMLCDARDVASIESALRFFINASPEQLSSFGRNSRQRAVELFDKDKIVSQYLSMFEPKRMS